MELQDFVIDFLETIFAVFAFFGNLFILFLWWNCQKLRTNRNSYLISLSFANFLTSCLAIPMTISVSNKWVYKIICNFFINSKTYHGLPHEKYFCLFNISTILFIRSAVNLSLVGVAIDRFIAVRSPFAYRSNLTRTRPILILSFLWISGLSLGYSSFWASKKFNKECEFYDLITKEHLLFYCLLGKIIPATALIIIYGFIYCGIKKVNLELIFSFWNSYPIFR